MLLTTDCLKQEICFKNLKLKTQQCENSRSGDYFGSRIYVRSDSKGTKEITL